MKKYYATVKLDMIVYGEDIAESKRKILEAVLRIKHEDIGEIKINYDELIIEG